MSMNQNQFRTWNEVRKELFTPEEIAESDLRVALIGELIQTRKEKGMTQRDLEKLSGVKQPVIARIENGTSRPSLKTLKLIIEILEISDKDIVKLIKEL